MLLGARAFKSEHYNIMNNTQRLLALDAALVACEGCIAHPDIKAAISLLQDSMETHSRLSDQFPVWGNYLDAQMDACKAMVNNPQVFGYGDGFDVCIPAIA